MKEDRVYRFVGSEPNRTPIPLNITALKDADNSDLDNDLMILSESPTQEKMKLQYSPPLSEFDPFSSEPEEPIKEKAQSDNTIESEPNYPHHADNIPERLFIQMNQVSSPEEFLNKFVDMNDEDEGIDEDDNVHVEGLQRGFGLESTGVQEIPHPHTTERRTKVIPKITSPAGCQVEMRTVDIKDPLMENHVFYPWCVRLPRCSGCCPSSRLKCVPTKTSFVNVTAVQLDYEGKFNGKFKLEGYRIFQIEKHESCRCECIQQQENCNEHQIYKPDECRCFCKDPSKGEECLKRPDKVWIQDTCQCLCRHRFNCPTGSTFSQESCKCEADAPPQLIFDSFPNFRIHSTIDVEFKKQSEFGRRIGSSLGFNPDAHLEALQMETTTEATIMESQEDYHHEGQDNKLYPLIVP
jgi:hypothetical protein